jgi:murein L,D-transpeptidase YafK
MRWIPFLIMIFLVHSCHAIPFHDRSAMNDHDSLLNYNLPLKGLIDSLELKGEAIRLLICKSQYTLTVIVKNKPIKTYPVVLGPNPIDDKRMEGDGCTPEGIFGIRNMYPHRSWTKFIWIDYPNDESREKHRLSKQKGEIPETATIGGEIGIHGVPDGNDALIEERINWTAGCISLKTADINEIYENISKSTIVEIVK